MCNHHHHHHICICRYDITDTRGGKHHTGTGCTTEKKKSPQTFSHGLSWVHVVPGHLSLGQLSCPTHGSVPSELVRRDWMSMTAASDPSVCQQVSLQASQDTSAFGWVKIRQEEFRAVSTCGKMFFKLLFSQSPIITGQCWCKELFLEVHFLILRFSDSFKVGNELFRTHWRGAFLCRKIMVNGNQQKLYT